MREFDSDTGEELFGLLQRPIYGLPVASRRWNATRDAWLMKEFNSKGWTCTQSREDPSLFIITNPYGKHSFILIRMDDCDVYAEKAEDGAIIADKFDKRFTIKMVTF